MILQLIFIPLHSIYSKSYMYRLGILLTTIGVLIAMNAMAEMPRDYYPDNLEGRNKGALKSELRLRNTQESVTWHIDGTAVSNNIFSPASLSVGMHTISFETERVSGHVRVEITN